MSRTYGYFLFFRIYLHPKESLAFWLHTSFNLENFNILTQTWTCEQFLFLRFGGFWKLGYKCRRESFKNGRILFLNVSRQQTEFTSIIGSLFLSWTVIYQGTFLRYVVVQSGILFFSELWFGLSSLSFLALHSL